MRQTFAGVLLIPDEHERVGDANFRGKNRKRILFTHLSDTFQVTPGEGA
jgi:hypothetical protein